MKKMADKLYNNTKVRLFYILVVSFACRGTDPGAWSRDAAALGSLGPHSNEKKKLHVKNNKIVGQKDRLIAVLS